MKEIEHRLVIGIPSGYVHLLKLFLCCRLLRRDPMGALGYASLKPSLKKIAESADGRPYEMGVVAALRKGEVLGSQTVLKSDHCPGCQNQNLPEGVDGAPNFREVPGFPVYGVANPTIDGIRSVIQKICSSKDGRPVFWHNMREEPVIYINGKPFVLREVERPYKNMLEYTVIFLIFYLACHIYMMFLQIKLGKSTCCLKSNITITLCMLLYTQLSGHTRNTVEEYILLLTV